MKSTNRMWNVIIAIVIICFGVVLYFFYVPISDDDINKGNMAIDIIALIISIVALLIALSTYFSIDSVNDISRLEGNVLENDSYAISPVKQFKKYAGMKSEAEITSQVFEEQKEIFMHNTKTSIEFADEIQRLIDDYFIIGWCNYNNINFKNNVEMINVLLDKKYIKMKNISNGTQYVVKENIKLFKYLYKSDDTDIMEIRGDLFRNPYTKYMYFDSMGREYYFQATNLIRTLMPPKQHGENYLLFLESEMRMIKNICMDNRQKKNIEICLEKSLEAFMHAKEIGTYNKPYTMFIESSIFRVKILQNLLFDMNNDIGASYRDSINAWDEFIYMVGIDLNAINGSYMVTGVYNNYIRIICSYCNYLSVNNVRCDHLKEEIIELAKLRNTQNLCSDFNLISTDSYLAEYLS